MALNTLYRSTPRLFNRGPSVFTRLVLAVLFGLAVMLLDARFRVGSGVRTVLATGLTPFQWLSAQPVQTINLLGDYVTTVESAKQTQEQAATLLAQQALKAQRADALVQENERLRQLLGLEQALPIKARAAEVVYTAPDAFTRRVVIDSGTQKGVQLGAPVIDASGLVGQVVRVFPFSAEVTLVDNPQQGTPILNTRTGERYLVYGDRQSPGKGLLEVRFLSADTDFKVGDVLVTSGTSGVFPAGLPVGTVQQVNQSNAASSFLYVQVAPAAQVSSALHVLVLDPQPLAQNEAVQALAPADAQVRAQTRQRQRAARPGMADGSIREP